MTLTVNEDTFLTTSRISTESLRFASNDRIHSIPKGTTLELLSISSFGGFTRIRLKNPIRRRQDWYIPDPDKVSFYDSSRICDV